MDIAQVQYAERLRTFGEDGESLMADFELVLFPPTVGSSCRAGSGTEGRSDGETAPDSADAVCQGITEGHG
jgi:hypothetical protein